MNVLETPEHFLKYQISNRFSFSIYHFPFAIFHSLAEKGSDAHAGFGPPQQMANENVK